MMRCSRPMSCALANRWLSGGRRNTTFLPAASVTRYVRFERPPAMSANVNGARSPPISASSHSVTGARSIPTDARHVLGHGQPRMAM